MARMFVFVLWCLMAGIASLEAGQSGTSEASADGQAAVTNPGPLVPFLEGTDVFFSLRKDTVFEADIRPHLIAFQNFTDVLDIHRQADLAERDGTKVRRFAWSITGTPAVRLRMFEEVSRPVRTPSYMPGGNVQLIWARNV